jgi:hypothetical protein
LPKSLLIFTDSKGMIEKDIDDFKEDFILSILYY